MGRLKLLLGTRQIPDITPIPRILVNDNTELTNAINQYKADGGVQIVLKDGVNFDAGTVRELALISPILPLGIIAENSPSRVWLGQLKLTSCRNLVLDGLGLGSTTDKDVNCILLDGTGLHNSTIKNCEMRGKTLNPDTDDYGEAGLESDPAYPRKRVGADQPSSRAFRSSGSAWLENVRIYDNYIHDLGAGIKPGSIRGRGNEIIGNILDKIYTDHAFAGWAIGNEAHGLFVAWNLFSRRICLYTDYSNPHGDYFQTSGTGQIEGNTFDDITFIGNIFADFNARGGGGQGRFLTDANGGRYRRSKHKWNIRVAKGGANDLTVSKSEGNYVYGDILVRENPIGGVSDYVTLRIMNTGIGWQPSYVGGTVAESIDAPIIEASTIVARDLAAYNVEFDGPTYNATTIEEILTKYKHKVTASLGGLRSAVDYVARTYDATKERPWLGYISQIDVPIGQHAYSNFAKCMGGGPNQAFVSDVPYRFADDELGTNATSWFPAGSGTVNEDQFVQLDVQASGTSETFTYGNFKIRGKDNIFSVHSDVAQPWTFADNGGVAYSTTGTNEAVSGRKKFLLYLEHYFDAPPENGMKVLGNGSGMYLIISAGKMQLRFRSGSCISATADFNIVPGAKIKQVISVDLTKTTASEVLKWYINGTLVVPTGTIATDASWNFSPSTHLSSMGVLAQGSTGAGVVNGKMGVVMWDYTDAAGVMPDVSDPAVLSKFNKADLGADGSGVLGRQAKAMYYGPVGNSDGSTVGSWNATGGVANYGSYTLPMIKQAGVYA